MKCPLWHWWNKAFFLQHMCVQHSGWVRIHVAVGLANCVSAAGRNKSCKAYSSSNIPRIDTDKSKSQWCGSASDISSSSAAWRHAVRGEMCAGGKPQPAECQTGGSRSCADGGCRFGVDINNFLMLIKQMCYFVTWRVSFSTQSWHLKLSVISGFEGSGSLDAVGSLGSGGLSLHFLLVILYWNFKEFVVSKIRWRQNLPYCHACPSASGWSNEHLSGQHLSAHSIVCSSFRGLHYVVEGQALGQCNNQYVLSFLLSEH